MILEGVITTLESCGLVHIAAMGAEIGDPPPSVPQRLVLRPYQSSRTFGNLRRDGRGVFHITDDVELLARSAVGQADGGQGMPAGCWPEPLVLPDACRWYALEVRRIEAPGPRSRIEAAVVASGRNRDFWGFNRAKHAVVEAAILASRAHVLPLGDIRAELARLAPLVEKTGGPAERRAFAFLCEYLEKRGQEPR